MLSFMVESRLCLTQLPTRGSLVFIGVPPDIIHGFSSFLPHNTLDSSSISHKVPSLKPYRKIPKLDFRFTVPIPPYLDFVRLSSLTVFVSVSRHFLP